jgi:hypothetical protein
MRDRFAVTFAGRRGPLLRTPACAYFVLRW